MRRLFAIGAVLALAAAASAAPNVGNATQKGSLLIWPDIRVDGNYNTIVRIANDGSNAVAVKCYWMDGNKNRNDFVVDLTKNQTIWFDAKYGDGTKPINPMPKDANYPIWDNPFLPDTGNKGYKEGLLVCFAVRNDETDAKKWNHLSGTAVVFNADRGTAYEYSAYAFVREPSGGGDAFAPLVPDGIIDLNGFEYDSCPQYMTGSMFPYNKVLSGENDAFQTETWFRIDENRLAVAGCRLDLKQDWVPVWTKLQFDVWDSNETKATGGYECADSWHEVNFGSLDAASQVFNVRTDVARYRVEGGRSDRCQPATDMTTAVGILAVQSTRVEFAGRLFAAFGTTLTGAGKVTGSVLWDPVELCAGQTNCNSVPEGRIR
jgi:hypothetical protein